MLDILSEASLTFTCYNMIHYSGCYLIQLTTTQSRCRSREDINAHTNHPGNCSIHNGGTYSHIIPLVHCVGSLLKTN